AVVWRVQPLDPLSLYRQRLGRIDRQVADSAVRFVAMTPWRYSSAGPPRGPHKPLPCPHARRLASLGGGLLYGVPLWGCQQYAHVFRPSLVGGDRRPSSGSFAWHGQIVPVCQKKSRENTVAHL